MQEEVEHKTVNFAISTTKLTARTFLKGAQFLLRQYDKNTSQGKQSMKRLIRQNRGVTNVEIEKTGIKGFAKYAKRYHIDYAVQKDISCTPPRYMVLFQGAGHGCVERGIQRIFGFGFEQNQATFCAGKTAGTGAGGGGNSR